VALRASRERALGRVLERRRAPAVCVVAHLAEAHFRRAQPAG
jgi:hypothetical protein